MPLLKQEANHSQLLPSTPKSLHLWLKRNHIAFLWFLMKTKFQILTTQQLFSTAVITHISQAPGTCVLWLCHGARITRMLHWAAWALSSRGHHQRDHWCGCECVGHCLRTHRHSLYPSGRALLCCIHWCCTAVLHLHRAGKWPYPHNLSPSLLSSLPSFFPPSFPLPAWLPYFLLKKK